MVGCQTRLLPKVTGQLGNARNDLASDKAAGVETRTPQDGLGRVSERWLHPAPKQGCFIREEMRGTQKWKQAASSHTGSLGGSTIDAQATVLRVLAHPSLPALWKPLGFPQFARALGLFAAAGMSSISRMSSWLGELVSSTYKYTRKQTPYGCLNKVMLKRGDLCQQTEMNLHATACSNMLLSGKSWQIFCVQPCIRKGITGGAELLWNLRLWFFNST